MNNFARELRRAAGEGSMVGIGISTHSNPGLARAAAEARARGELARQMESLVTSMIEDSLMGSEYEDQGFQFTVAVNQVLARQRMSGVIIADEYRVGGEQAIAVRLSRGNATTQIRNATAEALAPHVNAHLWSTDRMAELMEANNMAPETVNPLFSDRDDPNFADR